MLRKLVQIVGGAAAFWLTVITILSLAASLDRLRRGETGEFEAIFQSYAFGFALWLILCPIIYYYSKRDVARHRGFRITVLRALALFLFCLGAVGVQIFYISAPLKGTNGWELISRVSVVQWTFDLFIFGMCYLRGRLDGERILKETEGRERAALSQKLMKLEGDTAKMEMQELRHRFSSHFMLNALSNILGLVRAGDTSTAEHAVLSLAEILKRVSRGPAPALSPLRDELEFVEAYVQFQRIRYPDIALTIDFEDSAKRFVAPDFILQPLVENAFKHGMASDGTLSIRLEGRQREDGGIAITLINSVEGREMTGSPEGIGLNLTRSRLQLSFGEDFEFSSGRRNGQYCVTLVIPGMLNRDG